MRCEMWQRLQMSSLFYLLQISITLAHNDQLGELVLNECYLSKQVYRIYLLVYSNLFTCKSQFLWAVCHSPAEYIYFPAPVDLMSANAWLHKHPSITCQKLACESKLCSVVRWSIHQSPGKWMAIGCAAVHYAQAARAFSARSCLFSPKVLFL